MAAFPPFRQGGLWIVPLSNCSINRNLQYKIFIIYSLFSILYSLNGKRMLPGEHPFPVCLHCITFGREGQGEFFAAGNIFLYNSPAIGLS